jgi:hypothetical protein
MTEAKQEKPKNRIPKPISQAFLAGSSAGVLSYVFGVPVEYLPRVALAGAGFSLWLSWQDSRYETSPKKRKAGRSIPFNHGRGSQRIDMEYSMSAGGTLIRETYLQAIWRKLLPDNSSGQIVAINSMERPKILDEFIFVSHYRGQAIQLREKHVKLFLASAWKLKNGKGLSIRHWERRRSQRPAWYKELPPLWFRGMSMLLWNTQKYLNRQIVITLDNQQSFLAVEPFELFILLKWYECEKRKK